MSVQKEMAKCAAHRSRAVKRLKLGRALEAAALKILHTVARRAAKVDSAQVSYSEIALAVGASVKTVQRATVALEDAGLVERVGGRRRGQAAEFALGEAAIRPELRETRAKGHETDSEKDKDRCQRNGQNCPPLYRVYTRRPFQHVATGVESTSQGEDGQGSLPPGWDPVPWWELDAEGSA